MLCLDGLKNQTGLYLLKTANSLADLAGRIWACDNNPYTTVHLFLTNMHSHNIFLATAATPSGMMLTARAVACSGYRWRHLLLSMGQKISPPS